MLLMVRAPHAQDVIFCDIRFDLVERDSDIFYGHLPEKCSQHLNRFWGTEVVSGAGLSGYGFVDTLKCLLRALHVLQRL